MPLTNRDDWRTTSVILDQLIAGRSDVWHAFVMRFREPLVRLATRRGLDAAEAEDAAQQTLLILIEGIKGGTYHRNKGRLSAWLFGIARLEIGRRLERAAARERRGIAGRGETFGSWIAADDEEHVWEKEWRTALLKVALARVREEVEPRTFEAFERVLWRGESPDRVAAALGMSRNAVFIAKHRVLTRMRALEDELEQLVS